MQFLNDDEEQWAQGIACTHLVQGCEDAVSKLVLVVGKAGEPPAVRQRAHDILAGVLTSWREVLESLPPVDRPETVPTEASSLDGWTSDQLFAEAMGRRADDASALRLMQDVVLRARLSAHDRSSAPKPAEG